MTLSTVRARSLLAAGDLRALFIEELGWDRHSGSLSVAVDAERVVLHALAQKRGMIAYECPTPVGTPPFSYAHRRRIEHQVAKSAHEHLIVFTNADNESQVWQWVKREPGKPAACREHTFHRSQPGDALLQKLNAIAFSFDEEELVSLPDVTKRARAAFDVERVTKRFYDRFQKEHAAFLNFITGITEIADREWYASVMLNRLMFVYFIQRKGFLDGDSDYLRNRLSVMRAARGKDKFYSFYRYFLLRLFHEGLGGRKRTRELEELVGRIPYLNGGLFDVHELEKADRYGKTIQIPDSAFETIFDYFDQYQWHLDERPLRADNEINPDVLGYIFEKYINQKQMGAYYTKEDITEYISKSTVLPFVFEAARGKCKVAFDNEKGPTIWDLLKVDPDRYIYPAVRHGAAEALPAEILRGVTPPTLQRVVGDTSVKTVELRADWNRSAPDTHGLPTETWRELIARRARYEQLKAKLAAGEVRDINDLVTLNLDVRQFAQDAIETCDSPDLLRAFWEAIESITILDPTCGSGAFLFAALNILEPLYEACLDRMEAFVEGAVRSGKKVRPETYADFNKVLARVAAHPNRRYFIFKSIILNNLFGVDIMDEAVEICKLRLFLKLAAQVEPNTTRDNLGIEPLPDIDFNIRTGNTLIGYTTLEAVKHAATSRLNLGDAAATIAVRAADLQRDFDDFRVRQTDGDASVPASDKQELRRRLQALGNELNEYLASDYDIRRAKKSEYSDWLRSHQPFHWLTEFHGIMQAGGFDVIIGNPPYVEYSKIRDTYAVRGVECLESGNLYAFIVERCARILKQGGRIGMIIQLSAFCTPRMLAFQDVWFDALRSSWLSFFDDRPGKLFDGLEHIRVAIAIGRSGGDKQRVMTSRYNKFATEERRDLFATLYYMLNESPRHDASILKVSTQIENALVGRIWSQKRTLASYCVDSPTKAFVFYGYGYGYWGKVLNYKSYFKGELTSESTGDKYLYCRESSHRDIVVALMNSSLFYWFYVNYSDGHNFTKHVIGAMPFTMPSGVMADRLRELCSLLMTDLAKNATRKEASYKATGRVAYDEFVPRASKPIIDQIDRALAAHYGLSEAELDFVISFDAKYRMGVDKSGDGE